MPSGDNTTTTLTDPQALATAVAEALVDGSGKGLQRSVRLGPVSDEDRRRLQRITGETPEAFNNRVTQRLESLADKAMDRIEQKLDSDSFKSGELAFVMTSALDKRHLISGRSQISNASVNVQINNYCPQARSQLLDTLFGSLLPTPTPEPLQQPQDCQQ